MLRCYAPFGYCIDFKTTKVVVRCTNMDYNSTTSEIAVLCTHKCYGAININYSSHYSFLTSHFLTQTIPLFTTFFTFCNISSFAQGSKASFQRWG